MIVKILMQRKNLKKLKDECKEELEGFEELMNILSGK
jgi:hypothetical protein